MNPVWELLFPYIALKWNVALSMRQFCRDHYILLIAQLLNERWPARKRAWDFIISDMFKGTVDPAVLLSGFCFLSHQRLGASGQVGVCCRMIHLIVRSIKTNLHWSPGHWSFFLRVCDVCILETVSILRSGWHTGLLKVLSKVLPHY